jgi:hypothetical protein
VANSANPPTEQDPKPDEDPGSPPAEVSKPIGDAIPTPVEPGLDQPLPHKEETPPPESDKSAADYNHGAAASRLFNKCKENRATTLCTLTASRGSDGSGRSGNRWLMDDLQHALVLLDQPVNGFARNGLLLEQFVGNGAQHGLVSVQ